MYMCIETLQYTLLCTVGPSKTDTIGEMKFVLNKKMSFIQGFLNAVPIHFGT